jgi:hypothetical protein
MIGWTGLFASLASAISKSSHRFGLRPMSAKRVAVMICEEKAPSRRRRGIDQRACVVSARSLCPVVFSINYAAVDTLDIALRLGTATLVGAVLGLNRDLHGKPTGVRNAVNSLTSATAKLLEWGRIETGSRPSSSWGRTPARSPSASPSGSSSG